jgi:hypothetical protein
MHVNVPAHTEQEINQVGRVAVPAKQVIAYKTEAKEQFHLTQEIQDAPEQQVLSAATVKSGDRPQTVTTILDTRTGESREFVQAEPLPRLTWGKCGEISADLIEKFGGSIMHIQARQDLFQVKAVHLYVMAGGDAPLPICGKTGRPDARVGEARR